MPLIALLAAVVVVVKGQQGHADNQDIRAIQNQLAQIFKHDIDFNNDGVSTMNEALQYFHLYDNGDCQWNFTEMRASRDAALGDHGAFPYTEDQLRAMFTFYDTRGCSQAADGAFKCDDIPVLFGLLDTNGDGQLSLAESEAGSVTFAQHMAGLIPTGTCPATTLHSSRLELAKEKANNDRSFPVHAAQ